MPLAGRWVKNRGRWVSVGDEEVKTRTLYSNERNVIRDKCEKQFLLGEKVSFYFYAEPSCIMCIDLSMLFCIDSILQC